MAVKWNCTVGGEVYESTMDPIGFLFVIVFGFIMVIQLCGMLLHRVFTFLQIVSMTVVCGSKAARQQEEMMMSPASAVTYMKNLIMPDDDEDDDSGHNASSGLVSTPAAG